MKKYVKITLCGLAAMMLVAGCTKKEEIPESTAAPGVEGTVTTLGTYKGLEVTKLPTDVTDEEVQTRINGILAANPEYIEITDRPAQLGDVVNIDYVGMKDGTAFEGGTSAGYDLELGSGSFIDGFEDGLIGAKTGDELSLNLTFPESYGNKDLAGQAVVFDVTVNSIEEKKEAVLDNNFVQRMSDFTTVDEFQADTLAAIEEEKQMQAEQQLENDILLAAIEQSEFDIKPEVIEEQSNGQVEQMKAQIEMYGMTLEDYLAFSNMTEEQMKEQMKADVEIGIKVRTLVAAIAKAESITVEDTDREAIAKEMGMTLEELNTTFGADLVDQQASATKVIKFMIDNAVIK